MFRKFCGSQISERTNYFYIVVRGGVNVDRGVCYRGCSQCNVAQNRKERKTILMIIYISSISNNAVFPVVRVAESEFDIENI